MPGCLRPNSGNHTTPCQHMDRGGQGKGTMRLPDAARLEQALETAVNALADREDSSPGTYADMNAPEAFRPKDELGRGFGRSI